MNNISRIKALTPCLTGLCLFASLSTPSLGAGWVASGNNGTLFTSNDGLLWMAATSGTTEALRGVASDETGSWLVVGHNHTILSSDDTATWTIQDSSGTPPHNEDLRAAAYFNAPSTPWMTVGLSATFEYSLDRVTWNVGNPSQNSLSMFSVAYDGNSTFVASGANNYFVSSNGVDWTQKGDPGLRNAAVAWGAGNWVLVGADEFSENPFIFYTSNPDDRNSWIQASLPANGLNLRSVTYSSGQFIAVGNGGLILASPDGITWSQSVPNGVLEDLNGVAGGSDGQYVAVGDNSTILTSQDGSRWTLQAPPSPGIRLYGIASGPLTAPEPPTPPEPPNPEPIAQAVPMVPFGLHVLLVPLLATLGLWHIRSRH